jgi:hypothetical protein
MRELMVVALIGLIATTAPTAGDAQNETKQCDEESRSADAFVKEFDPSVVGWDNPGPEEKARRTALYNERIGLEATICVQKGLDAEFPREGLSNNTDLSEEQVGRLYSTVADGSLTRALARQCDPHDCDIPWTEDIVYKIIAKRWDDFAYLYNRLHAASQSPRNTERPKDALLAAPSDSLGKEKGENVLDHIGHAASTYYDCIERISSEMALASGEPAETIAKGAKALCNERLANLVDVLAAGVSAGMLTDLGETKLMEEADEQAANRAVAAVIAARAASTAKGR